ncbi:PKD-like family lipoprotein [Marinifilum sp. D714]|uniref:PKD-like family lipoprotein n=1 Tax=Marinifilum sp. D714 TaxID=2937523 RepID=UPI0027CCA485|nr:PKD-like family lipoprotein [Marinifilum sp. D714]MDQ2178460.1 PKD-like family lipoprotein [Marinifilum sp. D714]
MKNKIYIVIIIASFFMVSCLKDEGNYEYENLAYVQEIKGIEEAYSIYQFEEELVVTPEITIGNSDFNKDDYDYKWYLVDYYLDKNVSVIKHDTIYISTDKDLKFTADTNIPIKKMMCVFEVTSKGTGIVFKESTFLTVKNSYSYGTFILHQKGNNSELCLIKENEEIVEDVFGIVTGGKNLSGKPKQMCHFYANRDELLNIYTDQYPDYGAIFDFSTFEYLFPASVCFFGEIPKNADFQYMESYGSGFHSLVNNKYFYLNLLLGDKYRPYFDYSLPDFEEDVVFTGKAGLNIVHGAETGQLYSSGAYGFGVSFFSGGHELKMPGKMLCMMLEPGGSMWSNAKSRFYVRKGASVTEYACNCGFDLSKYMFVYDLDSENEFVAPELIDENTLFSASETEKYLFFTKDNVIYRYNYDDVTSKPVKFYEYPAGSHISYFKHGFDSEGERLEVGIYDSSNSDKNASLYYLDRTGKVTKSYENICGKIVDIVYKNSI